MRLPTYDPWLASVRCVLLIVLALTTAGCEPPSIGGDWKRVEPPRAAASFTLKQLDGTPVSLTGLSGQVVVMEFWATWCAPCRQSLPSLEAIAKKYKDRGVSVLLINVEESADSVRRWMGRRYTTPVLLDGNGAVSGQYGVSSIPRLFVLNQAGQLVWMHAGYGGGLEQSLSMILDDLLQPA
jgi:thiol-disulfide isomerase/thioredoxin